MKIKPDQLAYWYFRLNGFLTTTNFIVHPDHNGMQRTEIDILGVRFPYRAELLENPMKDDTIFISLDKPCVVIAEIKNGMCDLNGPWTKPKEKNMQRVLKGMGVFEQDIIDTVADKLYRVGFFENNSYYLSLFCIGRNENSSIREKYPKVQQQTWKNILQFIYDRFEGYKLQKAVHNQWDEAGQDLWKSFETSSCLEEFIEKFRHI